jgi:acetylornithine deacetylase/succinyl-diaminopimelate desuccinylase-like protein
MAQIANGQRQHDIKAMLQNPPDMQAVARLSQDPIDNSTLHTTCVATRLNAGHANNALPQRAQANVNCRIFPGHSAEDIRQELIKVFADPKIDVKYVGAIGEVKDRGDDRKSLPPPPLRKDVFDPLNKIVAQMWPGAAVVPTMSTGASDGIYTNGAGMPTYGIGGEGFERSDIRAHGQDERVRADWFYKGVDFYYAFLKAVTSE